MLIFCTLAGLGLLTIIAYCSQFKDEETEARTFEGTAPGRLDAECRTQIQHRLSQVTQTPYDVDRDKGSVYLGGATLSPHDLINKVPHTCLLGWKGEN